MVKIYSWGLVFLGLSIFSQAQSLVKITAIDPAAGTYIPNFKTINVSFDRAIEGSTVNENTIKVFGRFSGSYGTNDRTYISSDKTSANFYPNYGFKPNEPLQLSVTAAIKDASGLAVGNPMVYQYRARTTGNGNGTFVDSIRVNTETAGPGSLFQLGDMNGDTHIDIVEYDSQGLLTVHRNQTSYFQAWSSVKAVNAPLFMHLADMAGDGYLDVIVIKDPDKKAYVYHNINGEINPTPIEIALVNRPFTGYQDDYIPISGDIDADGDLDLVFGNGDVISVLVNSKAGQSYLVKTVAVTNGSGNAPVFMDVDNDGDLDIVTQSGAVCKNDGTGNFTAFTNASATIISSEELDIDNDGDIDLAQLLVGTSALQIRILKNETGVLKLFNTVSITKNNSAATSLFSGDYNGDGWLDVGLAVSDVPYSNKFLFLYNNGKGGLDSPKAQNTQRMSNFSATADMDNDGDLDFVSLVNEAGLDEKYFMIYYNGIPCTNPLLVTTVQDNLSNPSCGMLRYALENIANDRPGRDTILFDLPKGKQIIKLMSQLNLYGDIYIKGPGSDLLSIENEEGNSFRNEVPRITPSVSARLEALEGTVIEGIDFSNSAQALHFEQGELTVKKCSFINNTTGSSTVGGGGIYFSGTNLTLDSCLFSGNKARYSPNNGEGYNGAAVYYTSYQGKLIVSNSTFDSNYGETDSEPIYSGTGQGLFITGYGYTAEITKSTFSNNKAGAGAAISNSSLPSNFAETITISNSTFSGNKSKTRGGAFYITKGNWIFENVTITQNGLDSIGSGTFYTYPAAAGIWVDNSSVTFTNTILAGNFNKKKEDLHVSKSATAATKGGNIFGGFTDDSGTLKPSTSTMDLYDAKVPFTPFLAPLSNNGGATLTHLPFPNSPAIDFGVTTFASTDQRGNRRLLGNKIDAGAVETEACKDYFLVTRTADDFACGSLRTAVYMANATKGINTIRFDKRLANDSIVLSSRLSIEEGVIIHGIDSVAISTTGKENIFNINTTQAVLIDHLILRNSQDPLYSAIHYAADSGSFTLKNVTLTKNSSYNGQGAALYSTANVLSLDSCRFSFNTSQGGQRISRGGALSSLLLATVTSKITIRQSEFKNNTLNSVLGANGGGAFIQTTDTKSVITIENSTFANNSARQGAGLYLSSQNVANISNSTFSGNSATTFGGGMFLAAGIKATFTNVTISNNTSLDGATQYSGGGLYFNSGNLYLHNTLIAANNALRSGKDIGKTSDASAKIISLGNNLIGDTTDGSDRLALDGNKWSTSDVLGTTAKPIAPRLLPLAYTGGLMLTHLPLATSPVVNKGSASANLPLDQRGKPRIGAYDIGAVEVQDGIPPDAFAGNDTAICATSVKLKANSPLTGETGKWTSKTSTVAFANTALFNTSVTNLPSGIPVTLYWTVSKGTLSTTDSVVVTNRLFAETISAGRDTTVIKTPYTLSAKLLANATYAWYRKGETSFFSETINPIVTLKLDSNVFYLSVNRGGCSKRDTVVVMYIPLSDTANAGIDRNICSDSLFLQAIKPARGAHGKWTFVNVKLKGLANDTLYNTKWKGVPYGTERLVWTVTKGTVVTRDTVLVKRDTVNFTLQVSAEEPTCSNKNGGLYLNLYPTSVNVFDVRGDLTNLGNSDLGAGTYKVRIIARGTDCAIDTAIKLNSYNPYSMRLSEDTARLCQDDTLTLFADLETDSGPYDADSNLFTWNKNGAFYATNATSVLIKENGNYSVLIDLGTGCQMTDTATVMFSPKPSLTPLAQVKTCTPEATLTAPSLKVNQKGKWTALTTGFVIEKPDSVKTRVTNLRPWAATNEVIWTVLDTKTNCAVHDTIGVYYALTILTQADDVSGLAGRDIYAYTINNDQIAPPDFVDTLTLIGNTNNAILGWSIRHDTVIFRTNRKLASSQTVAYRLTNSCGYVSNTGTIRVLTLNVPPHRLDTIIPNSTASKNYTFTIPVKNVDANNYLDTVYTSSTKNGVLVSAMFNKDTTELLITLNYNNQSRIAEFEEVVITVCDDTLGVRRCNTIYVTVPVQTISKPEVFNAVSPNGDGKHDVLEIDFIEQYPNNRLKIFNRWGDKVFDEKEYDGKKVAFDGKSLPDGTYYYVLELGDGSKPEEGFIVLKR